MTPLEFYLWQIAVQTLMDPSFFITFKATPHFDGKHVVLHVFGKVVNGMGLLRKLEQVGSEKGKPACIVKIVDCGEVSDKVLMDLKKRGKKLKKSGRDLSSDDSSDGKGRARHKSRVKDRKKRRRRYSLSDSYSSDDSDSDFSSFDCHSDSDSSSSETSSSSDNRRRRGKKTSRKDKPRSGKKKIDRRREKQQKKRSNKRSRRKSKRSSESSSDSDSESANTSNSDVEKVTNKAKHAPDTANKSPRDLGVKSPSPVYGKETAVGGSKNDEQKGVEDNFLRRVNCLKEMGVLQKMTVAWNLSLRKT